MQIKLLLKCVCFLTYQVSKNLQVRQPTLLTRLLGNKHFYTLLTGGQTESTLLDNNLTVSLKTTNTFTL
jgi:hypothetical protein